MAGVKSQNKGKRAEREVVKLLQPVVNEVYAEAGLEPPLLQRNLMQAHLGGHDLAGLEWLSLEVKHQEQFQMKSWWDQTMRQAGEEREGVLFYRKNNVKWRVRMLGYLAHGPAYVYVPVDISLEDFINYFRVRLASTLENG